MCLHAIEIASSTKAGDAAQIRGGSPGARRPPITFIGAALPVCGVEVLIVLVRPWVLADIHEANLFVVAFHERFRRAIVLAAQRPDGAACFYGPTDIVGVLQALPFELIPWRQLLLRSAPPPFWRLPIPEPRRRADDTLSVDTADILAIATLDPPTTVR